MDTTLACDHHDEVQLRVFGDQVGPPTENTAVVAEFKGPKHGHGDVFGVVRIVQIASDTADVEATVGGLRPGTAHTIAGDLHAVEHRYTLLRVLDVLILVSVSLGHARVCWKLS